MSSGSWSDAGADRRSGRFSSVGVGDEAALPTVRDILTVPAVVDGSPDVLVGGAALDARVRWVHTSDSADVARLLNGGELLLSTGSGWPVEPTALRAFVERLVAAGLAGLVVELGTHYRWVPAVVVDAARRHGLALVTLHHEVKFVSITEAVHRGIIQAQTAALRARDEVRDTFTALTLRGSPADYVVQQLALVLHAPVVLENLAHEIVTAEVPPAQEESVFRDWERRSRTAYRVARVAGAADAQATVDVAGDARAGGGRVGDGADAASVAGWLVVPVEARGMRWGHLVALPGPEHPAGRIGVLRQGAIALALGRLADATVNEWERHVRARLLDRLLAGRFAAAGAAAARVSAAGLPLADRVLYGCVITRAWVDAGRADAAARTLGGRALTGSAPGGLRPPAATLLVSLPENRVFDDATVRAFTATATDDSVHAVVSVGAAAHGLEAALGSVQEAVDLARGSVRDDARGVQLRRADQHPLLRLVTDLRDDRRLLEHGERMLAPLIDYDLARGGDLLEVLDAALAHPANRTAAAAASHLSRSVFYQRIALIERLLGCDLDDGETQTALHVALLVRRTAGL